MTLNALQVLDAGGDGDATGVDASALVHKYGRSFAQGAPELALEYYMQARAETYSTLHPNPRTGVSHARRTRGGVGTLHARAH